MIRNVPPVLVRILRISCFEKMGKASVSLVVGSLLPFADADVSGPSDLATGESVFSLSLCLSCRRITWKLYSKLHTKKGPVGTHAAPHVLSAPACRNKMGIIINGMRAPV